MWFLGQFLTSISDIMWGVFQFIWFREMIAPHTIVFGHHLSAITAQQIAGLGCQIAGFVSLPFGALLTDRCERKWVYRPPSNKSISKPPCLQKS